VSPLGHGDEQEDPFTAFFVTLELLDMAIVPLLFRYYKHNIGTAVGVVCMVYFTIYMHIILIFIYSIIYTDHVRNEEVLITSSQGTEEYPT
jgi:hypothetical protein